MPIRRLALIVLSVGAAAVGACGTSTGPSASSYTGEWSGTTAQGRPVAFTISSAQAVTTITLGHDFNGCSGSQTFSSLALTISPTVQCIPGPCSPALSSYRAFSYASGDRITGPSTEINAVFVSRDRVEGTANFRNFPVCGSAIGVPWSATRR